MMVSEHGTVIRTKTDSKQENWYALTDILKAVGEDTRQSSKFVKKVPDPYKVKAESPEVETDARSEIWWLHQVGAVILLGTMLPKNEKAAVLVRKLVRIPERNYIDNLCGFMEVEGIIKREVIKGRTIITHLPGVIIDPLYTEEEKRQHRQTQLAKREAELREDTFEEKVKKIQPRCQTFYHTYKDEYGRVCLSNTHEVLHPARLWALGLDKDGKPYKHTEEELAILEEADRRKAQAQAKAQRESVHHKEERNQGPVARQEALPDDFKPGIKKKVKIIGDMDDLQDVVKVQF
jgi:hypothetical protein